MIKMKKNVLIGMMFTMALFLSFKPQENSTWTSDKNHSKLGFTITHLMISDVEGWFKGFDATITSSKEDFSDAVAELTVDINSINTDIEKRDNHLRSPDFFDVAKYPVMTFKSKTFKKVNSANYKVTGDLTMHGVTKTVELDALCRMGTNPQTKQPIAGFKITGIINRSDFGIGPSMGPAFLGEEVTIFANAEFIKK
jgi:polyisoprenoid-binding protein YceI